MVDSYSYPRFTTRTITAARMMTVPAMITSGGRAIRKSVSRRFYGVSGYYTTFLVILTIEDVHIHPGFSFGVYPAGIDGAFVMGFSVFVNGHLEVSHSKSELLFCTLTLNQTSLLCARDGPAWKTESSSVDTSIARRILFIDISFSQAVSHPTLYRTVRVPGGGV
jgi:hypothetical protein